MRDSRGRFTKKIERPHLIWYKYRDAAEGCLCEYDGEFTKWMDQITNAINKHEKCLPCLNRNEAESKEIRKDVMIKIGDLLYSWRDGKLYDRSMEWVRQEIIDLLK